MKRQLIQAATLVAIATALPFASHAQGLATDIHSLQGVLDTLYSQMIPMCSQLTGVGRGIAGFAATWYIASRVWRHIANAEPVDFYPLMRPFVIGFAIMVFPSVIGLINSILQPTVTATSSMVQDSDKAIATLLQQKQDAIKQTSTWQMYVGDNGSGDRDKWYKYTHPNDPNDNSEGMFSSVGNDIKFAMEKASYNFKNEIKQWMSEVLEVLYEAAALCINTIRTFYLVVLAILGPLVFGISVFDGFQYTLSVWLARYINIFLWLPVANIFGSIIGKIQQNMLTIDIAQVQTAGDTFFSSTDTAYLIFMIIGIIGYFTVPSVANYIVSAGGGNALLLKTTNMVAGGASGGVSMAAGRTGEAASNLANAGRHFQEGLSGESGKGAYGKIGSTVGKAGAYMHDKLSGKS